MLSIQTFMLGQILIGASRINKCTLAQKLKYMYIPFVIRFYRPSSVQFFRPFITLSIVRSKGRFIMTVESNSSKRNILGKRRMVM